MARFIPSPDNATRPATAGEMKTFFGLRPEDRWPAGGIEESRYINGIEVWVDPLIGRPGQRKFRIRVMARCGCGAVLTASRLRQHRCATCPGCGAPQRGGACGCGR